MRAHAGHDPVRSEINVTPLVDVCLVLLIIFMVVTPMLEEHAVVRAPQTDDPHAVARTSRQLTIEIDRYGAISVDGTEVVMAALESHLSRLRDERPRATVAVRGDRRVRYREVGLVLRRVHDAGFARAALLTDREQERTTSGN